MNIPSLATLLYLLPAAFLAPIIHQIVRARVSHALGDNMPQRNGFITWNLLRFFEPIGFILTLAFHFGWAIPVNTSSQYYKDKRAGTLLVCIVPVIVNLLVGMISAFSLNFIPATQLGLHLGFLMLYLARINIAIAIVNLIIPVYPFRSNTLLKLYASPEVVARMNHYEKPMQILFILMVVFGIIPGIVNPITNMIFNAVML